MRQVDLDMMREGWIDPNHFYGTINCNGLNAKGEVCGVTTTSGMAFKIPGRLGDSPVLGGAALRGRRDRRRRIHPAAARPNLFNLTSFLVVEAMRRGMHPKDAGMEGLKRIRANTVEQSGCIKANGDPNFNVNFYVLNTKGEYASVSMDDEKSNINYAVCTEEGAKALVRNRS